MDPRSGLADVELRLLERDARGYPIELTLNMEQEFPRGYADAATLPAAGEPIAALPERLFTWLFSDDALRSAWAEIRGRAPRRRLRLRIDAAAPELHALPWELLREPIAGGVACDLAASVDTPLSRYLAGRSRPGEPVLARPLRILAAIASPADLEARFTLPAIDRAAEVQRLRDATAGLPVEITLLDEPCTLARLEAALRGGHHVLHFVGHGLFSPQRQQAALLLADAENQAQLAPEGELAAMFARQLGSDGEGAASSLRLVFLMSCQSATRSPGDAFRGLAPQLVRAGVPAVVAMQDLVPMRTAHAFAETFYRQLLVHGQVDLAVNEGRSAILSGRLPGATLPGHAIPTLFMRLREGRLLGTRGRVAQKESSFWPFLLGNLESTRASADRILAAPIIGPRANQGLLPGPEEVARRLAAKYKYPLADADNLLRVAQFVSLSDPELLRADYLACLLRGLFTSLQRAPTAEEKQRYRRMSLNEVVQALDWAPTILTVQESTLYHQLARLELPLYLTTNADPLMLAALRQRGLDARQEGPRWEAAIGQKEWSLDPPPTPAQPVVFHLNGHAGDPVQRRHLVLSEDDHLRWVVQLSRDQTRLLPSQVLGAIGEGSLLFIGHDLGDWSFRVLLDALFEPVAGGKRHVGVQLEIAEGADRAQASEYLARMLNRNQIDVYWGSAREFVADLADRWANRGTADAQSGDIF